MSLSQTWYTSRWECLLGNDGKMIEKYWILGRPIWKQTHVLAVLSLPSLTTIIYNNIIPGMTSTSSYMAISDHSYHSWVSEHFRTDLLNTSADRPLAPLRGLILAIVECCLALNILRASEGRGCHGVYSFGYLQSGYQIWLGSSFCWNNLYNPSIYSERLIGGFLLPHLVLDESSW